MWMWAEWTGREMVDMDGGKNVHVDGQLEYEWRRRKYDNNKEEKVRR